jgi:hypothetical protein
MCSIMAAPYCAFVRDTVMIATLDDVTSRKKTSAPTAEQLAANELVRRAREHGLSLTGRDGVQLAGLQLLSKSPLLLRWGVTYWLCELNGVAEQQQPRRHTAILGARLSRSCRTSARPTVTGNARGHAVLLCVATAGHVVGFCRARAARAGIQLAITTDGQ